MLRKIYFFIKISFKNTTLDFLHIIFRKCTGYNILNYLIQAFPVHNICALVLMSYMILANCYVISCLFKFSSNFIFQNLFWDFMSKFSFLHNLTMHFEFVFYFSINSSNFIIYVYFKLI